MTGPLEGDLRGVTDDEWRAAHEALAGRGVPEAELAYTWAPDLDGAALVGSDEVDVAPRDEGAGRG